VVDGWLLFVFRYAKLRASISRGFDKLQHWPLIVSRTGGLRGIFFLWTNERERKREEGREEEEEEKEILQHQSLLYYKV